MVKNIELEQLVINKLTQAQYDALAVKNPGELYFITDATPTKEIEKQLVELSEKVPEPISTYESFPEATAENVGLRVVYTGETIEAPSIENENASVSTVFLDPYLTRGHTFMLVPVELSLDTEPTTVYMWQDVNGAIPPIGDDTSGKMLSNNGITYEWTEVVSGEKLPDQTDNEGALLTTDGTNPQWTGFVGYAGADNFGDEKYAIILDPGNKQTSDYKTGHPRTAINPMGDTAAYGTNIGGTASSGSSVSIGAGSLATNLYAVAVGANAVARGNTSTAVGNGARATNTYSIQLGKGLNDTESTFSVGFGDLNNYRLLEADGTIPAERMSSTVGTTGQVLTKTDAGMEWQEPTGGATGDYLPLSGGTLTGDLTLLGSGSQDIKRIIIKYDAGTTEVGGYIKSSGQGLEFGRIKGDSNSALYTMTYGIGFYPNVDYPLGSPSNPWSSTYTKKLNNGADLDIPTVGGTLARVEDIDAAVGDISTALTSILGE